MSVTTVLAEAAMVSVVVVCWPGLVLQCCSVAETSHPTAQGGGPLVILPPGGYVSAALSKLKTSAS